MNAVGMGSRRLFVPIGAVALGAFVLTLSMTVWLGPWSVRTLRVIEDRLRSSQAPSEVQPRVFDERFPNLVLYVQDVTAAGTRWRGVFLSEFGAENVSRLTLADEAIVIGDREQGKVELHLSNGSSHDYSSSDPSHYGISAFGQRDISIVLNDGTRAPASDPTNAERSLRSLWNESGANQGPAHVEVHRRLAFPFACIAFALIALPLGSRPGAAAVRPDLSPRSRWSAVTT